MKTVVIIPARVKSTRLPAKLLQKINGKTVIENCYSWACRAGYSTFVASSDDEILSLIPAGHSISTMEKHHNGTERCSEAAKFLDLDANDVVINVQGDIALYDPMVLNYLSGVIKRDKADMATACCFFDSLDDFKSENKVKACTNERGNAIFFSRKLLFSYPYARLHVGVYAMKAFMLGWYKAAGPCSLEQEESLEQMRWLHYAKTVRVFSMGPEAPITIDTPEDLVSVEEKWERKVKKWIK